jgi:2,5-diketo-D-gluconate reductase A
MMKIPSVKLNDGRMIPHIGMGTWKIPDADAPAVIADALSAGYRLVDTASEYKNEPGVGAGLRDSQVPAEELFLTTKIWNAHQGYDTTMKACEESLKRLGRPYLDLYLIHWPAPAQDRFLDTWRALIALQKAGSARSIGVSNFTEAHLERIIGETGVVPAVNQIELNPGLPQRKLRAFHQKHGIVTESWSPLARGGMVQNPAIIALAQKHKKNPAQVILRWHIENNLVVIPKSTSPVRLRENIAIFDFSLDTDDMAAIDGLDENRRLGPNPDTFQ